MASPNGDRTGTGPRPATGMGGPVSRWRRARVLVAVLGCAALLVTGIYAIVVHSGPSSPAASPESEAGEQLAALPSAAASSPTASASPRPSTTPTPRPSAKPTPGPSHRLADGSRPSAHNTGVPAGTRLTAYRGPCTITAAGTVIDAKTVNCDLDIRAARVTIRRSKINGAVVLDTDVAGANRWSYTLADSEVDAGLREHPAVSYGNMSVLRSNVYGGITSVQCGEKAVSCTVEDSWLHGQRIPADADWHLGGFLSNGGHNIRIRHNSIVCDTPANPLGEGCTGDLNLLGDFAAISDVVVEHNFLGANTGSSFCLYGGDAASKPYPHADHVIIRNNVFQRGTNGKCAAYGPVSSFNVRGPGNAWIGNTWQGGGTVAAAM
jgi:hypothetical protein